MSGEYVGKLVGREGGQVPGLRWGAGGTGGLGGNTA